MDFAMSPGGLVVHSRSDWPCACCRPRDVADSRGLCLCIKCARRILNSAEAGVEGMRALLDDVTDALTMLEGMSAAQGLFAN